MIQLRKPLTAAALVCAALAAVPTTTQATLLAYEGFNYDVGQLTGNSGGGSFGFSSAWLLNGGNLNHSLVAGGSFGYTDINGYSLVTSGNRGWFTGNGGPDGANVPGGGTQSASPLRILDNIYGLGADVTPYSTWISFLALRTDPPSPEPTTDSNHSRAAQLQFFYNATTTATGAGSEMFGVGRATQSSETDNSLPNDTWGVVQQGNANATKASGVSFVTPPADLILMRVDHVGANGVGAGDADTLRVWINPLDLNVLPSDGSADIVFTSDEFTGALGVTRDWVFDRIRLFAGNPQGTIGSTYTYGQIEVDELRIGTTFASVTPNVIPEPTLAALLGLGGLFMVNRLRKSRG